MSQNPAPSKMPETNWMIIPLSLLVGLGVVMVYSASIRSWPTNQEQIYLGKQLLFLLLSLCCGFTVAMLPSKFWSRGALWIFLLSLLGLVLVLVPGIGTQVNGSRRWIRLAGYTFQPAELAKLTVPMILCSILIHRKKNAGLFAFSNVQIFLSVGITTLLIMAEPDLGTAIFILMAASITLFLGGWPLRYFILGAMTVVPLILLTLAMNPYQMKRIHGMMSSIEHIEDAPYQVKQSILAISSGDWYGRGLGEGILKLSFLPESNNDFIYAVIGEELGVFGTVGILMLWLSVLAFGWSRIVRYGKEQAKAQQTADALAMEEMEADSPPSITHDDPDFDFKQVSVKDAVPLTKRLLKIQPAGQQSVLYCQLLAYVLLLEIVLQAMINVAVVTASAPPKGISHPLLSYGGSNLLVTMMMLGIIQGLTRLPSRSEEEATSIAADAYERHAA